jgi:transcriptional regulator of acetoin/glycerol metabolism
MHYSALRSAQVATLRPAALPYGRTGVTSSQTETGLPFGNRRADQASIEAIRASWHRSASAGLSEADTKAPRVLSRTELEAARENRRNLLKYAEPSVQNTYEQIAGTGSVVLLTDAEGVILSSKGDTDFFAGPHGPFFVPGVSCAERAVGANAMGTCIARRAPITVDADEHYLLQFRSLCGSAAPIFDSSGRLAGTFAAYGINSATHAHTLGLIRTVAVLIENRLLERELSSEIVIHFHPVAEYIGTIKQGIAVFSEDGKLLGSNSAARSILRIDTERVADTRFHDVFRFNLSLQQLVQKSQSVAGGQLSAQSTDGRELTLVVNVGSSSHSTPAQKTSNFVPATAMQSGQGTSIHSGVLLRHLNLGDPMMCRAINKASMILGSDIPLLIEGESGVGKEVFTAAFHNSGPRQNGPFVAVNCAAIPEGLIETELFGYEEGAFTGAKRRGSQGKLVQANGGTLLLDEIGDMPLSLQARLLRVVQERQVTPLGSTKCIPVDVSIVCATHRDMRAEVAAGRFREDLYYRLNGLRIQLPSLRNRQDLDQLIDLVIKTESGRAIELDPDVRDVLRKHPWPGNIRQLRMVLRTSLAILGRETRLTLEHLPDEFIHLPQSAGEPQTAAQQHFEEGDLAHIELEAIRRAVAAADGNMSKAARTLGISRKTLYRKLGKLPGYPDALHVTSTKRG